MDRVRASLAALAPTPAGRSAWIPFEVFTEIHRIAHVLPAPTAPEVTSDHVVWSLVVPPERHLPELATLEHVCAELHTRLPSVACTVDTVDVSASDRIRYAVAWRIEGERSRPDLGIALRALARIELGVCVAAIERTARTLELRVEAPDLSVFGTTLALLAVAPAMSDVTVVEMDSSRLPVRALLVWPTDRADAQRVELADAPWPARCRGHSTVAADAAAHAPVRAVALIAGRNATGAIVGVERREWLVTVGDHVADATVTAIDASGVALQRGHAARARAVVSAFPPESGSAQRTPRTSVSIPLPPEPAAPLP